MDEKKLKAYENIAYELYNMSLNLKENGLTLNDYYEYYKGGLKNARPGHFPSIPEFPGQAVKSTNAIFERIKNEFDNIVLEEDKRINDVICNIISKYGLTDKDQLANKITEAFVALDIFNGIAKNVITATNGQVHDTWSIAAFVSELIKQVNMQQTNTNNDETMRLINISSVNLNVALNENAALKAQNEALKSQNEQLKQRLIALGLTV